MKKLKSILKNVKKELLSPSNFLRILGIITKKALIGPLKVNIDITNKCDMNCIMCWYHSPYLKSQDNLISHISLERFKNLVKELKRIKTKIILLAGEGEPLLHPNLEEMIEFIRKNSLDVEVMTNGYYLNREKIAYFKKIKLKKIIVSLHSPDVYTFKEIRPLKTKDDFNKIIDNLSFLRSLKESSNRPQFFIINVISSLNCRRVFEMTKLAQDLQADKILFKPLVLSSQLPKSLELTFQDKKELFINLNKILKITAISNNINDYLMTIRRGLKPDDSNTQLEKVKLTNYPFACYIPWTQSAIELSGNVLGCVYSKKRVLGNIYRDSFIDIWFGKEYNLFRKGIFCPRKCLGRAVYPLLF